MATAKERLAALMAARKTGGTGSVEPRINSVAVSERSGSKGGDTKEHRETSGNILASEISGNNNVSHSNESGTLDSVSSGIRTLPDISRSTHPLAIKFGELQQAIESDNPEMPYILATIHKELGKDFELVTIMTEEEIGLFVSGLFKHTGVTIKPGPKKSSSKKTQPIDISMLD